MQMMEEAGVPPCGSCALCSQVATLQCLICLKRGIRPAPSFCGVRCYREHWASHRVNHEACQAGSVSSEISTKSSASSTTSSLSVGTSSSSCSPVPGSLTGTSSPSSAASLSPTRINSTSSNMGHRRQRSQVMPRTVPTSSPISGPMRESNAPQNWGQQWPTGPAGSCHQPHPPHPWYEHGGWTPNGAPGMHHMHRGMLQEQMVGPSSNWGYPSRWSHPYYWGSSF